MLSPAIKTFLIWASDKVIRIYKMLKWLSEYWRCFLFMVDEREMFIMAWLFNLLGKQFDKVVKETIILPLEKVGISFVPQPSRWGAIAFLYALAMFFIPLTPALLSLYFYFLDNGHKLMWILIVALSSSALGLGALGLLAIMSTYFLRNQVPTDTTTAISGVREDLQGIRGAIESLKVRGRKNG
jgi:hypothetical protein